MHQSFLFSSSKDTTTTPATVQDAYNDSDEITLLARNFDQADENDDTNYNSGGNYPIARRIITFVGSLVVFMEVYMNTSFNFEPFEVRFCRLCAANCLGYPILQLIIRFYKLIALSCSVFKNKNILSLKKNEFFI